MRCRIIFERCIGPAFPRAALIEKDYAIRRWVEELAILGHDSAAGPTVQKHHRLALRVAALLVIDFVDLRHLQTVSVVRFDRGVKRSEFCHAQDSILALAVSAT